MTIFVGWLLLSTGCSVGFVAGSAFGAGLWNFGRYGEPRRMAEPPIERRARKSASAANEPSSSPGRLLSRLLPVNTAEPGIGAAVIEVSPANKYVRESV